MSKVSEDDASESIVMAIVISFKDSKIYVPHMASKIILSQRMCARTNSALWNTIIRERKNDHRTACHDQLHFSRGNIVAHIFDIAAFACAAYQRRP